MTAPTTEQLATLSVRGLQTIDNLLRGTKMGRKESKAQAAEKVAKALAGETDPQVVENMPSLLRSRDLGADAGLLETMVFGPVETIAYEVEAADGAGDNAEFEVEPNAIEEAEAVANEPVAQDVPESGADKAATAKAELDAAADAHRAALEAVKAAEDAAKATKARFLAAQKAAKLPAAAKERGAATVKAMVGNAPKPGTRDAQMVARLESDGGMNQAWIKANFKGNYSAAYSAREMAQKYGRALTVRGEGSERVFTISTAAAEAVAA